ncbi:Protein kinase [Klebsormidium nitens]|uniref:Protein kinase n=1 Tax=Klebsormidium nitens TaxID=105231 RepID=A0A1Y1IMV1_KLENI|nr:Protein kinase [Klebsormidium nitens]|eukprot:GAQ92235.1 Protein kinase [Klebsormidium nitens]
MAAAAWPAQAAPSLVPSARESFCSKRRAFLSNGHSLLLTPQLPVKFKKVQTHSLAIRALQRDPRTGSSGPSPLIWPETSIEDSYLRRLHRRTGKVRTVPAAAQLSAPLDPAAETGVELDKEGFSCEQFCEDDFDIHPSVSIGLGGRSDEALFEATVQKEGSSLRGRRVVLRQLIGKRAERWGRRALEVWQRVRAGRQHGLHPYMAAVHGFIPAGGKERPLVLVHAFYGSYSLHQWLLCPDWLQRLEARLSLDPEEARRRLGDATTGGAQVSRQQRVIKMLLRDALIGVNYLHQRGLAHTTVTLRTVFLSAADKRLKLCVPGNAVDLPPLATGQRKRGAHPRTKMMAFDIRCIGILMARLVLRELMRPEADAHFRAFLVKGHDPASLRESLLPFLSTPDGPYSSPGLQLLDRDGGVGWHLLARLLAPPAADRISAADALRHPFLCARRWRPEASVAMAAWMLGSTAVRITEEYVYNASQRSKMATLIAALERLQQPDRAQAWSRYARGEWRLLYHTGRQVGMTLRQSAAPVRIDHALLSISLETPPPATPVPADSASGIQSTRTKSMDTSPKVPAASSQGSQVAPIHTTSESQSVPTETAHETHASPSDGEHSDSAQAAPWFARAAFQASVDFVAVDALWPADKSGVAGRLLPSSSDVICDEGLEGGQQSSGHVPGLQLRVGGVEMEMELDYTGRDSKYPQQVLGEVRRQIPPELFDLALLHRVTYIDGRLLVLRGAHGTALLFTRTARASMPAFQAEGTQ